jgi:protein-tyrosine phosphatase
MKKVFLIYLFVTTQVFAGLNSGMPSTFLETGIPNSHLVSSNLIRGMAPKNEKDLQQLLNIGVEKFLIFKVDTNGDVAKEIVRLKNLDVPVQNISHISFPWKDITDFVAVCEITIDGLNFLKNADENMQKIFFHCSLGEDRTGYLAGLYKIYRGKNSLVKDIFKNEMCDRGYEAGNPKKSIGVVNKIRESLTPTFLGMIDLIEANRGKKLTKTMCKKFQIPEFDIAEFSCSTSSLL